MWGIARGRLGVVDRGFFYRVNWPRPGAADIRLQESGTIGTFCTGNFGFVEIFGIFSAISIKNSEQGLPSSKLSEPCRAQEN